VSYPSSLINSAVYASSTGFDPQMPIGKEAHTVLFTDDEHFVSQGVEYLEDGTVRLNMYAGQDATKVEVTIDHDRYPLKKGVNGIWSLELKTVNKGFRFVYFYVDGAKVINPLMQVGCGSSMIINVLEIPDEDFYLVHDVPHGTVTENYYYSDVTGLHKNCLVYTPPGYMKESAGEYPVLYLQHGHGENERGWVHQGKCNFIMDNLLARGLAEPCIMVMNNGMVQFESGGVRKLDPRLLEDMLIKDCIPFIEKTYRVKAGKNNRAMAGLSMGSMQTSVITMKNPDLFGYVGVFCGFVSPLPRLFPDGSHLRALDDAAKFNNDFRVFFRANGVDDDLVMERFESDNRLFIEKGLPPGQSCHIVRMYPGSHEWRVWRKCLYDFLQLLFR